MTDIELQGFEYPNIIQLYYIETKCNVFIKKQVLTIQS